MTDEASTSEGLQHHLELYLVIYQHHFDLYLKAIALYLAVIGTAVAYIFRAETTANARVILASFIILLSVGGVLGSILSKQWVVEVQQIHRRLASELGLPLFPFSGAIRTTQLLGTLCGLVAIAAILFLIVSI